MTYLAKELHNEIKTLYQLGLSAREIKEQLKIKVSVRQIQRYIKSMGIIRTKEEAFRLAVKLGKVKYDGRKKRKSIALKKRYYILQRDNFKCVLCGCDATEMRLEIDHINNDTMDNSTLNLRTLCSACNLGKARYMV